MFSGADPVFKTPDRITPIPMLHCRPRVIVIKISLLERGNYEIDTNSMIKQGRSIVGINH